MALSAHQTVINPRGNAHQDPILWGGKGRIEPFSLTILRGYVRMHLKQSEIFVSFSKREELR